MAVTKSGRGRFPGQTKYNDPVPTGGGYTYTSGQDQQAAELEVKYDLTGKDSNADGDFDDTGEFPIRLLLIIIVRKLLFGHLYLDQTMMMRQSRWF